MRPRYTAVPRYLPKGRGTGYHLPSTQYQVPVPSGIPPTALRDSHVTTTAGCAVSSSRARAHVMESAQAHLTADRVLVRSPLHLLRFPAGGNYGATALGGA